MSEDVSINHITEDSRILPNGNVEQVMRVEFMVGEDGPFTELIPLDDFSQETARDRLRTRAETIKAIRREMS